MAKPYALLFRHERREIEFDLVGVGILRESESLREAHDVGVDADGLLAESRCLARCWLFFFLRPAD